MSTTRVYGFQQITSLSGAQSLSIPVATDGTKPRMCLVHCETQAVRWRDDGTAPTSGIGMRLIVGGELRYDAELTKIQFIEETASAKINITYYSDSGE